MSGDELRTTIDPGHGKKANSRASLAIVAAAMIAIAGTIPEWLSKHEQDREAERWKKKARSFASVTTTMDEAQEWLTSNHFYDVRFSFGSKSTNTGDEKFKVVMGHRQLSERTLLSGASYLDLELIFTEEGKFQRVDSDLRHFSTSIERNQR